jgi:hypothetical protein
MAIFSIGQVTTNFTNATPSWTLLNTENVQSRLLEVGWGRSTTAGSAFTLALGRPAALGAGLVTSANFQCEDDPTDTTVNLIGVLSWTTNPTAPAQFFRRHRIFGVMTVQWVFPIGLTLMLPSQGDNLVLWNLVGTAEAVPLYAQADAG